MSIYVPCCMSHEFLEPILWDFDPIWNFRKKTSAACFTEQLTLVDLHQTRGLGQDQKLNSKEKSAVFLILKDLDLQIVDWAELCCLEDLLQSVSLT